MIKVSIDINKLVKNLRTISKLCKHSECMLIFSIKGLAGHQKLLKRIFQEKEVPVILGDSKELHFRSNINLFKNKTKILISVPPYNNAQEIKDILYYTDICYISTIDHIALLEKAAKNQQKVYSVILVFDSGDGREGLSLNDKNTLDKICFSIKNSKYLKIVGASTNIGCLSDMVPSLKTLHSFLEIIKDMQSTYKFNMSYVIGGSSNLLPLLQKQKVPPNINSICVGEAILLGTIPGFKKNNLKLERDVFSVKTDICEIKKLGKNSYQCLLLIGKNDINQADIILPKDIKFVNYSSDYTVIRINKRGFKKYNMNEGTIRFSIKYYALARLLSSQHTSICFVE